uniref:Uncharacterized protein n=1 Tax=Trichuris muris TaxID=70415 RepID=A0A5S6Q583_TRIMR
MMDEEPATYPRGISKTSRTCVCYEYEMQTDVQSEEPSFRPHTHEEALTVEPHEDDVEMLCLKAAVPSGRTHWKRMRSCS